MTQHETPFRRLIKRLIQMWLTAFLLIFGVLAILTTLYELTSIPAFEVSPTFILIAVSGIVALIVGAKAYRQLYRTRRKTPALDDSQRLFIEVNIPENQRVREVILDTEPNRSKQHLDDPIIRIRRR